MPEEHIFPIRPNDPYWIWHKAQGAYGSDNWLTASQYKFLFSELPDLPATIACSQMVQVEGLRYANQSMRRNMWHRSAFASWTYNEPWPMLLMVVWWDIMDSLKWPIIIPGRAVHR